VRQHFLHGPLDLWRKCCQIPKGVPVAVAVLQRPTIARMYALYHTQASGQFEVAIRLDGYASQMGAPLDPFRDHRPHQIACPKAMRPTRSLGYATWKAVFIHIAHLAALPACGSNQ